MSIQMIKYGNELIQYNVCFVKSKKKKVAIHVHPDGSVQVDAPEEESFGNIKTAVKKRARWISTHLQKLRLQKESVLPREYVSGEGHLYLGRCYPIKIVPVQGKNDQMVKLLRGQLKIFILDTSPQNVKTSLWNWYREHAKDYFKRRLQVIVDEISWMQTVPDMQLLVMHKQWGSCSPKGRISLNPHLVKANRECVEYVLYHEICHLFEHNHGKKFYSLLQELMPNWQSVKAKLDGMAEILLNE